MNEFGYFGKVPTVGDFVHRVLPQDFADKFHQWLQMSMAEAREELGDVFLNYYLNCPVWKFLMSAGVCGVQPVAGLTTPSVDRVGRYFNFTLATVLPMECDPIAFALSNREGFQELENMALDILEEDLGTEQIEQRIHEVGRSFVPAGNSRRAINKEGSFIRVSLDEPQPFFAQAGALLNDELSRDLGKYSAWWYGQEGQSMSNLIVCSGLPDTSAYLDLLTLHQPPDHEEPEQNPVDRILGGDS